MELEKPEEIVASPDSPAYACSAEVLFLSPMLVPLEKDLPRSWERVCFKRFRKGDVVTLIGMLHLGGQGCFLFAEGERGGYVLHPDQIKLPEDANTSQLREGVPQEEVHGKSDSAGSDVGGMVSADRADGNGGGDLLDAGQPVGSTSEGQER